MFTGIIEEVGRVRLAGPSSLAITAARVLEGMETGDSVAVNGVCLTVTGFDAGSFSVDVMPETLRRTNLGQLRAGDGATLGTYDVGAGPWGIAFDGDNIFVTNSGDGTVSKL